MLDHKETIIFYLSWPSLFLRFHILGCYIYYNVILIFDISKKQILIELIYLMDTISL
jgi:hypothetical protein